MNVSFYIYDVEGCEEYIRKSQLKICIYYNPTTSEIPREFSREFDIHRKLLTMEQIKKRIEEGYVIVPLSKSIYQVDLLKYYDLGLKPCFMTNKAFKIFRKVYKDYI